MTSAKAQIFPVLPEFEAGLKAGKPQLVWTVRPADLDTPVSAMLRLMDEKRPSFLLESVEKGEIRGRYSVIGLMPEIIWRCFGNRAEIAHSEVMDEKAFKPCAEDSLASLRKLYQSTRIDIPEALPPMATGLLGYMGYDMVKLMEKLPDTRPDVIGIPDACFIRPKLMVVFDTVTDKMFIVTSVWPDTAKGAAAENYAAAVERIQWVLERLKAPVPHTNGMTHKAVHMEDFASNTPRDKYDEMLEKAREYMRAGDIFQCVLSQRFSAPFRLPPFALYRSLRTLNPSPFLFYLNFCDYQIVGSSPEVMVRVKDGEVTIRPIAGTRRRGRNRAEDEALAKELLADPKELAEHLMLLDLGRNDVGRVAKVGTVKTTQRMIIENYSHVMHIVSNVTGKLDTGKYDALSALVAGFPAGTVSGAPKIRAMEIIDELEVHRRSFYAGCVGYFSPGGDINTAITLRTGLIKEGTLYLQAGGGIVLDSDSQAEYEESHNKAKALMRAAEEAINFV